MAALLVGAGLPSAALGVLSIADVLNEHPDTVAGRIGELGVNTALATGALAPGAVLGASAGALLGGRFGHGGLGLGLGALAGQAATGVPAALYMLNDGGQAQAQAQTQARPAAPGRAQ